MTRRVKRPSFGKRWRSKLVRFTLIMLTSALLILKPLAMVIAQNSPGLSEPISKVAQGRNVAHEHLIERNEQYSQSQTSTQPDVKNTISDIQVQFLDEEGNPVQNITPLDIVQAEITIKPGEIVEQSHLEADLQRIRRLGIAGSVQSFLQQSAEDPTKVSVIFLIIDEKISQWNPWMRDALAGFKAADAGDFSSAISHYEEVLRLVKSTRSKQIKALTLYNIGNLYKNQSDYQRALAAYQQAQPMLHDLDAYFIELTAWINIAISYNNLAEPEQAITAYKQALELARLLARNTKLIGFLGEKKSGSLDENNDNLSLLIPGIIKIAELMLTVDIATTYSTLGDYQQIIYLVNDSKLLSNSRNLENAWANIAKNLFPTNNLQGFQLELAQIIPKLGQFLSRLPEILQPLALRFTYLELGDVPRADDYSRRGQQVLQDALEDFRRSISEISINNSSSWIHLIVEGIDFLLDDQKTSQDVEAIGRKIVSLLETSISQQDIRALTPYLKIGLPFILNFFINTNDSEKTLDFTNRLLVAWRSFDAFQGEPNAEQPDWSGAMLRNVKKLIEAGLLNIQGEAYFRLSKNQQAITDYRKIIDLMKLSPAQLQQIQQEFQSNPEILQFIQLLQPTLEATQQIPLSDPKLIQQESQSKLEVFQQRLQSNPKLAQLFVQLMDFFGSMLQANAWVGLGKAYTELGELENARSSYYQALAFWLILGNQLQKAETCYGLAEVELKLGNLKEAQAVIERALAILEDNPPSKTNPFSGIGFTTAEVNYGYGFVNRGDIKLGVGLSSKGILDRTASNSTNPILGEACTGVTSYFACKQRYYDFYINLLIQLAQQYPTAGYNIAAFAASEKSRAGTPEAFSKSAQRILPLNQTAEFTAIQEQLLDDNTLLLEYFLGEKQSYLWVLSANTSLQTYVLDSRAEIEAKAREFYDLLTLKKGRIKPKTTAKVGMELTDLILKPIAKQLGQKRLLLVTDGILQFIPFSALPDPAAKTPPDTASVGGAFAPHLQPLLLNHEIINLPSASVLARIRQRQGNRPSANKELAIFANPVFNHADDRAKELLLATGRTTSSPTSLFRTTVSPDITILYPPLPGTQTEMERISKLIAPNRQVQYPGFAASYETALSPKLSQYRIIHFATHGVFNNRSPNRSGIVLSALDKTGELQRSLLSPADTFKMHLPATELVVLSACRTGWSDTVRRESLTGLTGGLMTAGVDRVLVSLWSIKDDTTAELIARFYQNLFEPQHKRSPAQALRAAQISMWNEPRWQEPYYWAAFTIQGEWR